MPERTYPADPAEVALRLFLRWFGGHYARSTTVARTQGAESVLSTVVSVGRRWEAGVTVLDTLSPETDLHFEAARAALEERLDLEGRSLALWVPRGARLPVEEPALSAFHQAIREAQALDDGRLEMRRPVRLSLRRTGTAGSVVTVLGGLSGHWAQFTNRVAGSYQLNSSELFRLPASPADREALADRVVLAAQQPDVEEMVSIRAEDAWTLNDLETGGSCVLGSPRRETDEQSSALRRTLRLLLKRAKECQPGAPETRALVLLGAATYAEDEKLSWTLRGMDPALYSGYAIIAVVADGLVRVLLEPPRQSLPWDAPLA